MTNNLTINHDNLPESPNPSPVEPKKFLDILKENFGLLNWVMTIVIGVGVFILTQRDTQNVQAQTVLDTKAKVQAIEVFLDKQKLERDAQYADFEKRVLSKELFEAYHKGDVERMERLEKMVQQLLSSSRRQ